MMDPPANQLEEPKRRRIKASSRYVRIALILSLTVLSLFWVVITLRIISATIDQQNGAKNGIIIFNKTKDVSESNKGELFTSEKFSLCFLCFVSKFTPSE